MLGDKNNCEKDEMKTLRTGTLYDNFSRNGKTEFSAV